MYGKDVDVFEVLKSYFNVVPRLVSMRGRAPGVTIFRVARLVLVLGVMLCRGGGSCCAAWLVLYDESISFRYVVMA